MHLEGLLQKNGKPHIFSIPEYCFVVKQLNEALFCRDMLKYAILCRKLLKYAIRSEKWLKVR